tara:strand:+ start:28272 stop:31358 length:3087 start_codon:yes stop_codon:yes gene_type:complete
MPNSKIPHIDLGDTLNTQRLRLNDLIDSVGNVTALKTTAGDVTAAINELYDSIGVIGLGSLNTTAKTLRQAINEHETDLGSMSFTGLSASDVTNALIELRTELGDHGALTTKTTVSAVAAINELRDSMGAEGGLTTATKNIIGAINEHETDIGNMTLTGLAATDLSAAARELRTELGDHSTLTTKTTVSAVAAINELRDSMGTEGGLTTTAKNLVGAINEHDAEIGSASLNTSANTLRGAINEHEADIGNMSLNTTASNLTAAINEMHDSIGEVALKTQSTTIKTAINELNDSIGAGGLNTTAQTLIGAINEIDADTTDAVTEGSSNLYFTETRARDAVGVTASTGLSYNSSTGKFAGVNATTTVKGVASFNTNDFVVSSGAVSLGSLANNQLDNSSITFNGTAVSLGGTVTVNGTANEVTVAENSGTYTIGLPDSASITSELKVGGGYGSTGTTVRYNGDILTNGNLTVDGDLTVSGTTTTINTATLNISDNIIVLNNDVTGAPSENAGLEVERGNVVNAGFRWNETSNYWEATDSTGTFYQLSIAGPGTGGINFRDDDNDNLFVTATTGAGVFKIDGGTSVQTQLAGSTLTVSVDDATISAKGIASFDSGDFGVSSGAVSIKSGGVSNSQLENSSITINTSEQSSSVSLGGTVTLDIMDSAEINQMIDSAFGSTSYLSANLANNSIALGTNTTGSYVATITAGAGLTGDGSGEGSTPTLALDFSELTDMTADIDSATEFILQNGATESRKAASEIKLSAFNNDANFSSTTGTVTSVGVTAGTGLSGGGTVTTSGTVSLALDFSELTDMTGAVSGTTEFILQNSATESRKAMNEITTSSFNGDGLTRTGDITLNASTDIILDADGGDVFLKDDGTTYGSLTQSGGELVIKSGSTPTTAITLAGANATVAGTATATNVFTDFNDHGIRSSTTTLNWTTSAYHEITTASSNFSIAFSNLPTSGKFGQINVMIENGSVGGVTLTWPAAVKWSGGVKPITPSAPFAKQLYQFFTVDNGTNVYGAVVGQHFA